MRISRCAASAGLVCLAAAVDVELNVTTVSGGIVESDWTVFYYGGPPLLLGNDGGPDKGGLHVYGVVDGNPLPEVEAIVTGRTKLVTVAYGLGGSDYAITIAQPDSTFRLLELPGFAEAESARYKQLGDWSALCAWKSPSRNHYVYLFGKGQAVAYLLQTGGSGPELVEVQSFSLDIEPSGCAVSPTSNTMYLSADDDKDIYYFPLLESTAAPELDKIGEAEEDVTGVAVYTGGTPDNEYIFVAQESVVAVYAPPFQLLGTMELAGLEDVEIQGLSVYQAASDDFPAGVLGYAIEADDVAGFGISSLDALQDLGVELNTNYDPHAPIGCRQRSPICDDCSGNGFCELGDDCTSCSCFAGWEGNSCQDFVCENDCSGNGECVGPNTCACEPGWGGLFCSFVLVEPKYETDANGADGDDPAIWISPVSPGLSRVVTTTKSEEGAGLGVFDLQGNLLQTIEAGEPNNVDMIYGFPLGDRTVDLAFAACREDDTLCLFEMLPNGTLADIPGGSHPVTADVEDFSVYGSCTYRSPSTGKQYLLVNDKSSQYLEYELTSLDGALVMTLVRDFFAGTGGQVEGCVADEDNSWVFIGEEPYALWRYGAEPDSTDEPVAVGIVGDGTMFADVEGVTLVCGKTRDTGFILVSNQGVSSYNVYRRAAPHEFVTTFTIVESSDGLIDAVTNTDGITAIGTSLGDDFPRGLVVVHDDANQLPDGSTSAEASFKLVGLEKILGAGPLTSLNLMDEVDDAYDPRA